MTTAQRPNNNQYVGDPCPAPNCRQSMFSNGFIQFCTNEDCCFYEYPPFTTIRSCGRREQLPEVYDPAVDEMSRLQVKDKGEWRNILEFHQHQEAMIRDHAAALAKRIWPDMKLRIVTEAGRVLLNWKPVTGWYEPPRLGRFD